MTDPFQSRTEATSDSTSVTNDIWRMEVHSRVSHFRNRCGRRIEGAFSMRFPFLPAERVGDMPQGSAEAVSLERHPLAGELVSNTAIEASPKTSSSDVTATDSPEFIVEKVVAEEVASLASNLVAVVPAQSAETAPSPVSNAEPVSESVVQTRPRAKRKVIAFPRPTGAREGVHRLADPVLPEQPRILDVPEELEAYPTTPFLDGLRFETETLAPASPADHVELPFRVASIPQRIYGAMVDCTLVAVSAAVFAFVGHKMLPNLILAKPVWLAAAAAPVLLWAIYQYLLLVYAGRTAGMHMAGIRLCTFKGRPPSLSHRRNRVLGLYLSATSLAMGLLWAFVDVDALCWHDRISGTYLSTQK